MKCLVLVFLLAGCIAAPAHLSPEEKAAWYAEQERQNQAISDAGAAMRPKNNAGKTCVIQDMGGGVYHETCR